MTASASPGFMFCRFAVNSRLYYKHEFSSLHHSKAGPTVKTRKTVSNLDPYGVRDLLVDGALVVGGRERAVLEVASKLAHTSGLRGREREVFRMQAFTSAFRLPGISVSCRR